MILFFLLYFVSVKSDTISDSLQSLCQMMPGMPGCSIKAICDKSKDALPSPYCTPSSLFTDICLKDMPRMGSCKNYSTICTSSECKMLDNLPTSATLTRQIYSICSEMTMNGCQDCSISSSNSTYPDKECNLLGTYVKLCKSMPNMSQCSEWKQMCSSSIQSDALCVVNTQTDAPSMLMYFHSGFRDYILFEWAVPTSTGSYIGSCILIILFACLYEGYQVLYLKCLDSIDKMTVANEENQPSRYQFFLAGLFRMGIRIIGAAWSYLLMLIVMSFNVGLFISVILGLGLGSALFGPMHSKLSSLRLVEWHTSELCC